MGGSKAAPAMDWEPSSIPALLIPWDLTTYPALGGRFSKDLPGFCIWEGHGSWEKRSQPITVIKTLWLRMTTSIPHGSLHSSASGSLGITSGGHMAQQRCSPPRSIPFGDGFPPPQGWSMGRKGNEHRCRASIGKETRGIELLCQKSPASIGSQGVGTGGGGSPPKLLCPSPARASPLPPCASLFPEHIELEIPSSSRADWTRQRCH